MGAETVKRMRGVEALVGPAFRRFGSATSTWRGSPEMLLVGTQRGGTTSLFRALRQHPGFVGPSHRKGVHYYDVEYHRGRAWYLGHFPTRRSLDALAARLGYPPVVGEASPYYLAHPLAARRFAADLPDVKVIAMLRDPIERAYSAHAHERARGYESREFAEAVSDEPRWVEQETALILADDGYRSERHRHHAYLTRGHYVDQLIAIEDLIGRERMLVVDSARYFARPETEFSRVLQFLELPEHGDIRHDRHNARPRSPLPGDLQGALEEHFEPYDRRLASWLGWEPSWRSDRRP